MSFAISFFVSGDPMPQPRPRAAARQVAVNGKMIWTARMYDAGTAEAWKTRIWACGVQHRPPSPLICPLSLDLTFYIRRPKDHYRTGKYAGELRPGAPTYHTAGDRLDRDNLDKAVMDTLEKMGFFANDSQVCKGFIDKLWCPVSMEPGCQIVLVTLDEPKHVNESQREIFSPRQMTGEAL